MTRPLRFTTAALLAPLLATGCATTELAPPPTPPATLPVIAGDATTPPAAGFTRVRLTTDVPARVYLHSDAVGNGRGPHEIRTLVCETTPCAFVVPFGDHELVIEGTESNEEDAMGSRASFANRSGATIVHAHGAEVVINETLGWHHSPAGRAVGAGMMFLGTVVTIVGVAMATVKGNAGANDAGPAVVASGLGSFVVGGIILAAVPSVEQPAATREWTPPATATAGGSLGFRF
jgi:hypothetical protein